MLTRKGYVTIRDWVQLVYLLSIDIICLSVFCVTLDIFLLIQNGAILNKVFQPHEAHIPFILQFFIDFNLYGMSFIDFELVKFRRTNFPGISNFVLVRCFLILSSFFGMLARSYLNC